MTSPPPRLNSDHPKRGVIHLPKVLTQGTAMAEPPAVGPQLDIKDFECPICRDLLYKPVVNVCGHVHCFWCVHQAMSPFTASKCSLCRHAFGHFPRICALLHRVVRKAFPAQFAQRAEETLDTELARGTHSPLVDPGDADPSLSEGDLSCAQCSSLLLHPLVLHCGHVLCASCAPPPRPACPCCTEVQPTGVALRVCPLIQDTVAALFPSLLQERRAEAGAEAGPSSSLGEEQATSVERAWAERQTVVQQMHAARSVGERGERAAMVDKARRESAIHLGVGCDSCGVYPIVGRRFQCTGCPEAIGFDLCGECRERGGAVAGRFNQLHTDCHIFREVAAPQTFMAAFLEDNPGVSPEQLREWLNMEEDGGTAGS